MWWPWRRPAPEPAGIPPAAHDDAAIARLRALADQLSGDPELPVREGQYWQRDPGVRVWKDLVGGDRPPAGEALAGPTMILPTLGPLATPAQQWRGHGGRP